MEQKSHAPLRLDLRLLIKTEELLLWSSWGLEVIYILKKKL